MAQASNDATTDPAFTAVVAGDIAGAIRIYRDRLRAAPRDSNLHHSLGQLLLMTGDFAAGWEELEWRKQPAAPVPRWRGAPLTVPYPRPWRARLRRQLQFARYVPMVAERGGKVVNGCRSGMKSMLRTVSALSMWWESGQPLTDIACHVPLMSLPYIFGTRLDTIRAPCRI